MTELTDAKLNQDLAYIDKLIDVEAVMEYLKKLDVLKYALEKMERFEENAVKYALLHAKALVKVVELGGEKELKGRTRKTAEWLASLTDDERNEYIAKCSEGLTIVCVYEREIEEPKKRVTNVEKAQAVVQRAIDEVEKFGIVDTNSHIAEINRLVVSRELANDIASGMRIKLLKANALGIGQNSGIYVKPLNDQNQTKYANERGIRQNIVNALKNRYLSVTNDLRKMHRIIQDSNIKLTYDDLVTDYEISHNRLDYYAMSVLWMLADLEILDKETLEYKCNASADNRQNNPLHSDYTSSPKSGRQFFLDRAHDSTLNHMQIEHDNEVRSCKHEQIVESTEEEKTDAKLEAGKYLHDMRQHAKMSQSQLASVVGVTSDYISMIERGVKSLNRGRALQIAAALNCQADNLLPTSYIAT